MSVDQSYQSLKEAITRKSQRLENGNFDLNDPKAE